MMEDYGISFNSTLLSWWAGCGSAKSFKYHHDDELNDRFSRETSENDVTTSPASKLGGAILSTNSVEINKPSSPQQVMSFPDYDISFTTPQDNKSIPKTKSSLILAVVDPKSSQFELLSLNIQSPKATIPYVLRKVIRGSASNKYLAKMQYRGICTYQGKLLDRSTRIFDIGLSKQREEQKCEDIEHRYNDTLENLNDSEIGSSRMNSKILVAIPAGCTAHQCSLFTRNILGHSNIVASLERHGVDTSQLERFGDSQMDLNYQDSTDSIKDDGDVWSTQSSIGRQRYNATPQKNGGCGGCAPPTVISVLIDMSTPYSISSSHSDISTREIFEEEKIDLSAKEVSELSCKYSENLFNRDVFNKMLQRRQSVRRRQSFAPSYYAPLKMNTDCQSIWVDGTTEIHAKTKITVYTQQSYEQFGLSDISTRRSKKRPCGHRTLHTFKNICCKKKKKGGYSMMQ